MGGVTKYGVGQGMGWGRGYGVGQGIWGGAGDMGWGKGYGVGQGIWGEIVKLCGWGFCHKVRGGAGEGMGIVQGWDCVGGASATVRDGAGKEVGGRGRTVWVLFPWGAEEGTTR